jgi:uncharacterized membrane protein
LDLYLFVNTLHVLSATVLFGAGAGIAFFMIKGHLSGVPAARRFAAARRSEQTSCSRFRP